MWRDRAPREVRIHQLVEERRNVAPEECRNLVCFRGYRLFMRKRRYRLFLEFCSGGDILNALDYVDRFHSRNIYSDVIIPEGFIWCVLKALASACLVLRTGTTASNGIPGWKPITHLDIQAANTFLRPRHQEHQQRRDSPEDLEPGDGLTENQRGKRPMQNQDEDGSRPKKARLLESVSLKSPVSVPLK